MATYQVKPEHQDCWGDTYIVTDEDIAELSVTWNEPVQTLLEQVDEVVTTNTLQHDGWCISATTAGQWMLHHPTGPDELYDSLDELIEDHPVCEPAREFFVD